MSEGHSITRALSIINFMEIICSISSEKVQFTRHSLIRLQEGERKIFKAKIIIDLLLGKTPLFVGVQNNGLYAVFYQYGKSLLKLILDVQAGKITIITFCITDRIPRI